MVSRSLFPVNLHGPSQILGQTLGVASGNGHFDFVFGFAALSFGFNNMTAHKMLQTMGEAPVSKG